MPKRLLKLVTAAIILAAVSVSLPACSDSGELVVYSGRNENLIRPLLEKFAKEHGDINVKYGDTAELLPTLLEEGDRSRADLFFSQDAGALAELGRKGMLARLPETLTDRVDGRFRDPQRRWVGVSGRARVIAYNTDQVAKEELPESVFDVIAPKWKGKVGFAPTNASFIAFVSALREQEGDDRAREFLDGLKANEAEEYDNNVLVLDAVASGGVHLGLVNHYYLYSEFKERADAPVANHYPGQKPGGEGTFVNIAGVGVLEGSDQRKKAQELVEFLLSETAQRYFRDETSEYPVAAGVEAIDELPPLDDLKTIDVPLQNLGVDLEETVKMIREAGLH